MKEKENQIEDIKSVGVEHKSEEVQAIIDRMPTYWVKWIGLCVGGLMAALRPL